MISLDFETRSTADLRRCGVYRYAEDASTDLWCMAFSVNGAEVQLWRPGEPVPQDFLAAVAAGEPLHAWNAQFERVIYSRIMVPRYGFPPIPLDRWHCTAAAAAAMALPRSLGEAAKVLGVAQQKDDAGHRLMLALSRPRVNRKGETGVHWNDDAAKVARLCAYCQQDVRAEFAVASRIRPLSAREREVYLLDQRMNDRGVRVDRQLVTGALSVADKAMALANAEIRALTRGAVSSVTQVERLAGFVRAQGVEVGSLDKAGIAALLAGELPSPARAVLELRAEAARTSVAKLNTLLNAACRDDRIRGMFLYCGAGTGRWSGKLVQPQNFPRGEIKHIEEYLDLLAGEAPVEYLATLAPPLAVLSSSLRSMLVASEGHRLMAGDYSAIEARVVNWIAGQEDVLDLFRKYDAADEEQKPLFDPYRHNATKLFRMSLVEVLDFPHRQTGKFQELGCGFQMGPDTAREQAAAQYGLTLTEEEAEEVVADYRARHPYVVQFWHDANNAALTAVRYPGTVTEVGRVRFKVAGSFLWIALPSGRLLCYAHPSIRDKKMPWSTPERPVFKPSVFVWGRSSYTNKWERYALYGGLITENIVQAIARDVMAEAMLRVEAAGYPVVMTVHDEIICDVPTRLGSVDDLRRIMEVVPAWANGLPVGVKVWEGERYRK